jgi:hypothetical protein
MSSSSTRKLSSYLAEFAVIVVGILLAFQVEEWREQRAEQRDVEAAMQRLMEETHENIQRCEIFGDLLKTNALSVRHVYHSLVAGEIIDGDKEQFVNGLTVFDVVPDVRMLTSVASEMTSTGLLKEVDDSRLRGAIARLPALDGESRDLLSYWRSPIIELKSEISRLVDYYYEGEFMPLDQSRGVGNSLEASMRVNYDFQTLAANRLIRNRFFEAVDVHDDVWYGFQAKCEVVEEIRERLQEVVGVAAH